MKNLLIIFLLVGLSSSSSFEQQEEKIIVWKENYLVRWDDFKGNTDTNINDESALISTGIFYDYTYRNSSYAIIVRIEMYKYQSWVINSVKSNYLLNHEQRHFDITEIFSRKFRKIVLNMEPMDC